MCRITPLNVSISRVEPMWLFFSGKLFKKPAVSLNPTADNLTISRHTLQSHDNSVDKNNYDIRSTTTTATTTTGTTDSKNNVTLIFPSSRYLLGTTSEDKILLAKCFSDLDTELIRRMSDVVIVETSLEVAVYSKTVSRICHRTLDWLSQKT